MLLCKNHQNLINCGGEQQLSPAINDCNLNKNKWQAAVDE
jgi:hypothetical protein